MTDNSEFRRYLEHRITQTNRRVRDKKMAMNIAYFFGGLFAVLIFVNIPMDIADGTFRWIDKLLITLLEFQVGGFYRKEWLMQRSLAEVDEKILERVAADEG